jgi:long-chain fatty acid transport protein
MKKIRLETLVYAIAAFMVFVSGGVLASDGTFSLGYGTKNKGIAGAGVAFPLSSVSSVTNPALSAFMPTRYDISLAVFSLNRQYSVVGNPSGYPGTFGLAPGTVKSGSNIFANPSLGANWLLNDKSSVNATILYAGGMNTDYHTNTFYGTSPTGVNLTQLFVSLSYARKLNNDHGIGITGIVAYQSFSAKGLQAFSAFSSDSTKLTNQGNDKVFGFGARIGYYGNLLPKLSVGAAFQTKIYMSKFKDYAGLFAEQGGFDVPANWTAGLAYKPTDAFTVAFDVRQILYSGVKSLHNAYDPAKLQSGILLGQNNGSGFGWRDLTVFKLGVQWLKGEGWAWRAGFSYGNQLIPSGQVLVNILSPGTTVQHLTFGVTRTLANKHEISFACEYALPKEIEGPNPIDAPNQQTIKLRMEIVEFEIGYSF